eukprot:PhM_4_TR13360/c0_g1_i1/m.64950
MDDIPIDIHYSKLTEWLEDRAVKLKKEYPAPYSEMHDASAVLLRNVKYEIPALKGDVAKATTSIRDAEAEIKSAARRRDDLTAQLTSEMKELALDGCEDEDVFRSLQSLVPQWMGKVVEHFVAGGTQIGDALALYKAFVCWQTTSSSSSSPTPILSVLAMFVSKGNLSAGEFSSVVTDLDELDLCVPFLLCDRTRKALVQDVVELQAFLQSRVLETQSTDSITALLTADAPEGSADSEKLAMFSGHVAEGLTLLNGKQTTHLLLLRGSAQYRTRTLNDLRLIQQKIARCHNITSQAEDAIETAEAILQSAAPKLDELLTETKRLQKMCEQHLAKIYHPREVNIMGNAFC